MKKISKLQYPSPYNYDPEENIRKLVNVEAHCIQTVGNVRGKAGKPIYQPVEWNISQKCI